MEVRPKIRLLLGPARCGKTAAVLRDYQRRIAETAFGSGFPQRWISPTLLAADGVTEALATGLSKPVLDPGVRTFAGFAQEILRLAGEETVKPITRLARRRLIGRIIAQASEAGELPYLGGQGASPGLAATIDREIADLKRRDVWAEPFAAKALRSGSPRDADLATIYSRYQAALVSHGAFDAEGLFWAARDALRRAANKAELRYSLLVVDGFADFTAAQHDVLRRLAGRCEQLWITLPWESVERSCEPGGKSDAIVDQAEQLFRRSAATLAQLEKSFQAERVELSPSASTWPAIDRIERRLLRDAPAPESQHAQRSDFSNGVTVLAASSEQGEIEALSRRVKQLLLDGAAASDVVVALADLPRSADRVRSTFGDCGIPFWMESPPRLASRPAVRSLLGVLRLQAEDWPYRVLLRVIGDRHLALWEEAGGSTRSAAERCVREAQLPHGRRGLFAQIGVWQNAAPSRDVPEDPRSIRAAATSASAGFQRLSSALDKLPREAAWPEWLAAVEGLAQDLALVAPQSPSSQRREVQRDLAGLMNGLRQTANVDSWVGPATKLTLGDVLSACQSVADETSAPPAGDSAGRVRVVDVGSVRHMSLRHLLLGGLSEQAFSAGAATDAPRDAEDDGAADRAASEMLMFYQSVARPTESLWLSYPALDAKAQPLMPSPFVTELLRCLGDEGPQPIRQPLGLNAQLERPWRSPTDERRGAVLAARDGDARELKELVRRDAAARPAIIGGLEAVAWRGRWRQFGPYDGLATGAGVRNRLAETFGGDHLWSASQLEHYSACPFKFFAEHVLGLSPTPELALESDFLRRGVLLHETLARLLAEHGDDPALATTSPLAEEQAERLVARFREVLSSTASARPGAGLDAALREIERRQIDAWAAKFARQHADYRAKWSQLDEPPTPRYFEARFGPGSRRSETTADAALSTDKPYEIALGEGDRATKIRLTGQIDRIDVGRAAGQTVFNVIDYKASEKAKVEPDKIRSGQQLQLALYAMAAADLLLADQDAVPLSAGYWSIRGKGYVGGRRDFGPLKLNELVDDRLQPSAEWPGLRRAALERVEQIVAGVQAGEFPVASAASDCTARCEFRSICRIAHARSLEKSWKLGEPLSAEPAGSQEQRPR
jgi:superfamily I DNA/RNA helicase/RecB family exonuclease